MSVTSGFFDSKNESGKYDRLYGSDDFGAIFDGVLTDGVIKSFGDAFKVVPKSGMTISVKPGKAWLDNTWLMNDGNYDLKLDNSEILTDRIDAVIIDINKKSSARISQITILKGEASSRPIRPALIHEASHRQYALSYVYVPAKATAIALSNITNNVGTVSFPYATSSMASTRIEDNLESASDHAFLSANMGRYLNYKFGGLRLGKSGDSYGYFVGDKFYVF